MKVPQRTVQGSYCDGYVYVRGNSILWRAVYTGAGTCRSAGEFCTFKRGSLRISVLEMKKEKKKHALSETPATCSSHFGIAVLSLVWLTHLYSATYTRCISLPDASLWFSDDRQKQHADGRYPVFLFTRLYENNIHLSPVSLSLSGPFWRTDLCVQYPPTLVFCLITSLCLLHTPFINEVSETSSLFFLSFVINGRLCNTCTILSVF